MLLLDFDGVLVNSLEEVVVTAYNAAIKESCRSPEKLPERFHETFLKNRFHLQPAGDFVRFARYLLKHENVSGMLSPEEFSAAIRSESGDGKELAAHFFQTRAQFIRQAKEDWLALHRPFEPLWSGVRTANLEQIAILTNKNREAVLELMQFYELDFPETQIYSAEKGLSKRENFEELQKQVSLAQFVFIEDSLKNLRDFAEVPQVKRYLASWGYVGPDDVTMAIEEGITPLTLEEVVSYLP